MIFMTFTSLLIIETGLLKVHNDIAEALDEGSMTALIIPDEGLFGVP